MSDLAITSVDPGTPELRAILRLHRDAKATLGFLPDSGFTDRAVRGTLLAGITDSRVVGYVLFDLTGDKVKVRHLCVDSAARGTGVARRLVSELVSRYDDRRCIELDCRRDYGLSDMWKTLGFHAVHDRPGRSAAGHLLTVWHIDFGHPTLFSTASTAGDLACLDQMVHGDLVVERSEGLHSRHLLDDWVSELVELCITDEVFDETNDVEDDDLRRRLLASAHGYRNLSRPSANWRRLVEAIAEAVPGAGDADHRHIARAIEGGALYFVTRDTKVQRAAPALEDGYGLIALPPEALLDRLDRDRRQDRYEPAVLQGTSVVEEALAAADLEQFVATLLNHGEGERAHELRATLRAALADRESSEVRVIKEPTGNVLAGVARRTVDKTLLVQALRAARGNQLTDAIARQLAFQQRQTAADRKLDHVEVSDPKPPPSVIRGLDAEGFRWSDGAWRCNVGRGLNDHDRLSIDTVAKAATYERERWPAKVIGAGLRTFMLSIEPAWAELLFDANLAEATLFPRDSALGLSREHVYYRRPGNSRALRGPARVLWYVKGGKPGHPTGHIRAVSHLLEVAIARPRTLHGRFAHLGVWSQEQVAAAAARTGQAMALRMTDTELLARPINLHDIRALYKQDGRRFQAPQGPISVDEHMFRLIYQRSSAYA